MLDKIKIIVKWALTALYLVIALAFLPGLTGWVALVAAAYLLPIGKWQDFLNNIPRELSKPIFIVLLSVFMLAAVPDQTASVDPDIPDPSDRISVKQTTGTTAPEIITQDTTAATEQTMETAFQETENPCSTSVSTTAPATEPLETTEPPTEITVPEPTTMPTQTESVEPTTAPTDPEPTTCPAVIPETEPTSVEETVVQNTEVNSGFSEGIVFIAWPESVSRGQEATVTIQGMPNTLYSIVVNYKSGPSEAAGLEDKVSDSDGYVSWTWRVGNRTSYGTFTIVVSGGGQKETVKFTVK